MFKTNMTEIKDREEQGIADIAQHRLDNIRYWGYRIDIDKSKLKHDWGQKAWYKTGSY